MGYGRRKGGLRSAPKRCTLAGRACFLAARRAAAASPDPASGRRGLQLGRTRARGVAMPSAHARGFAESPYSRIHGFTLAPEESPAASDEDAEAAPARWTRSCLLRFPPISQYLL